MNCLNQQADKIKERIHSKYAFLELEEVDACYDMALSDYLSIKYPSDNKRPNHENLSMDFLTEQWLYKRMVDILERAGGTSVTAYKENGVSFTYGGSYIDNALVAEIMPKGRVPR